MNNHVVNFRVNPDLGAQEDKWAVLAEPSRPYPWKVYPGGHLATDSEVEGWIEYVVQIPIPKRQFKPGDLIEVKTAYYSFRAVRVGDYWWSLSDDNCLGRDGYLDGKEYTYIGNTLEMGR